MISTPAQVDEDRCGQTPEEAVGACLAKDAATLCTAESCTGGLIAHRITNIPGSSAYYLRGWVAYSNEAKIVELGVPGDLIAAHGAVSPQVAEAMALGAASISDATYALATTGVAGPGGGSPTKPVGLVYIALAGSEGFVQVERHIFTGERAAIKDQAATAALTMLLARLRQLTIC